MITVDCSKVPPMKHPLLTYVADSLGVIPILKSEKFILTPIEDKQRIRVSEVISAIEKFLKSVNQNKNFKIIHDEDLIKIEILDGNVLLEDKSKTRKELFFECTHCGFMTQYETEWRNHKMIHYI